MTQRHDYVALQWIKTGLSESLDAIAADLNPATPMPGDFGQCLEELHRVHGGLLMIEFYGAALLAEEMEQLALALQQGRVAEPEEACGWLRHACNRLPAYLERVRVARRDLPLEVLPLVNELRSARGASLLAETNLFDPRIDLPPALDVNQLAQRDHPELAEHLRQWRQKLQGAWAALLRGQEPQANFGRMAKVFERLNGLCQDAPLGPLWEVAEAVVEGLGFGVLDNSPALRSLLRDCDRELKRLVDQGLIGVNQPAPVALLKSLLFVVARAERASPRMQAVRDHYDLDDLTPTPRDPDSPDAALLGAGRDALLTVVRAVCGELIRVKAALDQFVRGDRLHAEGLGQLVPALRQIADTLAVLGFGQPRKVILDQLAMIQSLAQGHRPASDATLMDVASALLYVEATLAGMAGPGEQSPREESRLPTTDLRQIHQTVIHEARLSLQQVKDLILDATEGPGHPESLIGLADLVHQIAGALRMIPLARAASLFDGCRDCLSKWQQALDLPPAHQLEPLADALASLDYYLERLGQDPEAGGDALLDLAEQRLAELGVVSERSDVPLLDEVLSPTEALVLQDMQTLDSPQVQQSLAEVLASPVLGFNPPAREVPPSLLPPPADERPVDPALRAVFLEEAGEILNTLNEQLPLWRAPSRERSALQALRRGFHSLKGSGRMVRALVVAELSWAMENLLNRLLDQSLEPQARIDGLLGQAITLLPTLIDEYADQRQRQRRDADELALRAHALARGDVHGHNDTDPELLAIFMAEAAEHLRSLALYLDRCEGGPQALDDSFQRAMHTLKGSAYVAGLLPIAALATQLDQLTAEYNARQWLPDALDLALMREGQALLRRNLEAPDRVLPEAADWILRMDRRLAERRRMPGADEEGLEVAHHDLARLLADGMDRLLDAEAALQRWHQHPAQREPLDTLLDALTQVGQAAHLADLDAVDELCEALLDVYGAVEDSSLATSTRFFEVTLQAQEALIDQFDQLAAGQIAQPRPQQVRALYDLLHSGLDPLATGLLRQGDEQITELGQATLEDELRAVFLEEASDVLDSAGQALQRWLDHPDNIAPLASLQRDLHTLKGGARLAGISAMGDLGHELEHLYEGLVERRYSLAEDLAELLQDCHDVLARMLDAVQSGQPLESPSPLIQRILDYCAVHEQTQQVRSDSDGADNDLLEIFLDESLDLLERSTQILQRWEQEPANLQEVEHLLRELHTLKGGARMVEIKPISDLAHELEHLYERIASGVVSVGVPLFALLHGTFAHLAQMLMAVRHREAIPPTADLIAALAAFGGAAEQAAPAPRMQPAEPGPGERSGVKITAELLEQLSNFAAEASIFQGRLEQHVNDAHIALREMEATLERMGDQLRRLDNETLGHRAGRLVHDGEGWNDDEFDPLEMDRHSQMQQLARGLSESLSDLHDLKETFAERQRSASSLLAGQARVNTSLQEGLMRARLVPFERLVPRLQRVVRQVASELGKEVELVVSNAEGELDRNMLERMIAPLEHMLRNAVDHGLEAPEARRAAGKPVQGVITLELLHQGGDILIEISDDGAGVPLAAVRRKAVKRGLLEPDSPMSDHDVLQFILRPGFSTAERVTQISGRGLGMDVVHDQVKQLGGSMSIESRPGEGARFRIRLPFTLSINRALMVQQGEEQYAIPVNTVDGIVRVPPNELQFCYEQAQPFYRYASRSYRLYSLGELLQTGPARPNLLALNQPLPVLLVQVHEQQVAVQLDVLAASREIVVKSLGAQFAAVPGISGATILGDGRVVLILDLPALVRAHQARLSLSRQLPLLPPSLLEPAPARPKLIMVVDDSVTMRKVTSRLLERHGMQVITAKDGVDAMAMLQQHEPDVLLLDIEMPRMDGFEVATKVRQDPLLRDLPIIMITSRTGQKHRDRAQAIGVNDYLGKPYQESVLLERIAHWSRQHA